MIDGAPDCLVHLVRHGEVWNPHHLVYSDLPGFGLSELGHSQAAQAADHLARWPVTRVVSSPLQRAVETAIPIAARHRIRVLVDTALTEWRLTQRWAGVVWEDLPESHPGELQAYLTDPARLGFSPEPLGELAERIATAVRIHATATRRGGHLVVVSHQDPIHAAHRLLTGRGFDGFGEDKPDHATIVTLAPGDDPNEVWRDEARWSPTLTAPV